MEDMNPESLVAMKCPLTQQPIEQAARAKVRIYAFVSKRKKNFKVSPLF